MGGGATSFSRALFVLFDRAFGLGLLGEYLSFGNNAPEPDKPLPLSETAGLGTRPSLTTTDTGRKQ